MNDILEERKKKVVNFFKDAFKSDDRKEEAIEKEDVIERRKEKLIEKFNLKKNWYWFLFAAIAWLGYWIRTRNLNLLIDVTTGKYIPVDLDAHAFLRYAKYIVENGNLMSVDYMRYYPWGYEYIADFRFLSYFIAYLYKFLHFFSSKMTIELAHNLYPPITFVIGLVFFFLLVRKLFDFRVALLSSLLLSIIPMYISRTMAGFGDKEAFAMVFFFASLYFFVVSWKSEDWKKIILFGSISGLLTGLLGLIWGGMYFIVVTIALFSFFSLFFVKYRASHFFGYFSWLLIFSLQLMIFRDVSIMGLIGGFYNGFAFFVLLCGFIYYLLFEKNIFNIKEKIKDKLPLGISAIILGIFLSLLFFLIYNPSFIFGNIEALYITLTNPFGQSRWALTVAEAHQPFFVDWVSSSSWKYILVCFVGLIWIFKDLINSLFDNKKNKIIATMLGCLLILGISLNRYSQGSMFNGETNISRLFYFGSMLIFLITFIAYYFYTFKKNKNVFIKWENLNENYIMIFLWAFVMIIGARSAIRVLFVLAPVTCILFSFLIFKLFDISLNKKDVYKIGLWFLIFLLLINPISIAGSFAFGLFDQGVVNSFYKRSVDQVKYTGSIYNRQWQEAGNWVRNNTPKDAVFAHWWDYGYLVQTGFERATVTDGGNAKGSLNHMMGRYFLTGQSELEALEFFKAHNVTHSLIISDEIGKYPAFSSIGADENWDRYSWINVFTRDDSQIRETRDGTFFVYTGGTPLDWDFEYKGKLYPKGGSGIIGIVLPISNENNTISFAGQPFAILIYNGKQETVPLGCVYFNGNEIEFDEKEIKGCFLMVPKIDGDKVDILGNGFYISEKVRKTLFYKLYLTGQESKYFKLVYDDSNSMPLSVYNGRVIGPLKIWEVSYPEDLKVPEIYYKDELPNPKVGNIEGRY